MNRTSTSTINFRFTYDTTRRVNKVEFLECLSNVLQNELYSEGPRLSYIYIVPRPRNMLLGVSPNNKHKIIQSESQS